MKTIKIFALPSHQTKERTTGVDMVRVIQPMKALNGYTDGEVTFAVTIFDINKTTDWLDVAKNYDIIYLNYINSPWGFAAMGAMARKHGVKIVFDVDDSLWHLKNDNPAYAVYKPGSEAIANFTAICNEVDSMTCTSSYLKNVILNKTYKRADKVKVFPNYIDLSLYSHRASFKNDGQITLLHYGSTTHFNDLYEEEFARGVDKIMSEYPHVVFKTVGAHLPRYKLRWGQRFSVVYGHSDIYTWIKDHFPLHLDQADILVVPLTDDIYNRCKSSIKFLESASAKKPGVWQRMRQYEEVITGKNGLLAYRASEWYEGIKKLIDEPELRRKMGEEALKTIEDGWQMNDHVKNYAEFFKQLLTE